MPWIPNRHSSSKLDDLDGWRTQTYYSGSLQHTMLSTWQRKRWGKASFSRTIIIVGHSTSLPIGRSAAAKRRHSCQVVGNCRKIDAVRQSSSASDFKVSIVLNTLWGQAHLCLSLSELLFSAGAPWWVVPPLSAAPAIGSCLGSNQPSLQCRVTHWTKPDMLYQNIGNLG